MYVRTMQKFQYASFNNDQQEVKEIPEIEENGEGSNIDEGRFGTFEKEKCAWCSYFTFSVLILVLAMFTCKFVCSPKLFQVCED